MTFFVNTVTMACPVFEGQVKEDGGIDQSLTYPAYTLPSQYAVVEPAPMPAHDPSTHVAEYVYPPVLTDGQWILGWVVRAYTDEELAQIAINNAAIDAEIAAAGSPSTPPAQVGVALFVEIP
jgi:hypothetical protein